MFLPSDYLSPLRWGEFTTFKYYLYHKDIMPAVKRNPIYFKLGEIRPKQQFSSERAAQILQLELDEMSKSASPHPYHKQKMSEMLAASRVLAPQVVFGYDLDVRPPYGGLPADLFLHVDPAISELVDKLAKSDKLSLTGQCCSGHVIVRADGTLSAHPPELRFGFGSGTLPFREQLWVALQGIEANEGSISISNKNGNVSLDGQDVPVGYLWLLKMWPVSNSYALASEVQVAEYLGALQAYWKQVTSALSSVLGVTLDSEIKRLYFTRRQLDERGCYSSSSFEKAGELPLSR